MYDRGILQGCAYYGEDLRHRWFADHVFRPDAVDRDVCWVKLVFRVNEDRQRFEHFARSEMNKPDRADAAKVSVGGLDVQRDKSVMPANFEAPACGRMISQPKREGKAYVA